MPNAELKIFMTASLDKRIQRRQLQMKLKGVELGIDEIRENLQHRDHIDSTRSDSPLRRADDALVLDTTLMTIDQQVSVMNAELLTASASTASSCCNGVRLKS